MSSHRSCATVASKYYYGIVSDLLRESTSFLGLKLPSFELMLVRGRARCEVLIRIRLNSIKEYTMGDREISDSKVGNNCRENILTYSAEFNIILQYLYHRSCAKVASNYYGGNNCFRFTEKEGGRETKAKDLESGRAKFELLFRIRFYFTKIHITVYDG